MHPEHDQDAVARHEPDMLVVETQHRRLVMDMLGDRAARFEDEDDQLGLTLVRLGDAAAAAGRVHEQRPDVPLPKPGPEWSDPDQLLANLRAVFAHDYGGWVPSMGKNRITTGIQFVTYPNAAGPASLTVPKPAKARIAPDRGVDPRAGKGVRVGLLDTRLYRHRRLAGRYIAAPDSLLPLAPPQDAGWSYIEGHAAFLGGLVLDEAPSAQLDVRPVVQVKDAGSPDWERSLWALARQMVHYVGSGVQILNCSWACYTRDGKPPFVLDRALALLTPKLMVVAAAGNHGQFWSEKAGQDGLDEDTEYRRANKLPKRDAPAFPAALPSVVAVGALGSAGAATFNPTIREANTEPDGATSAAELAPWINVLAPGVNITSAYFGDLHGERVQIPKRPDNGQQHLATPPEFSSKTFEGGAEWSGTSFAAATVTGAVAARIRPGGTAQEALDELLGGADDRIRRARPLP
jgi:membrane-anchored mycosin MYCP